MVCDRPCHHCRLHSMCNTCIVSAIHGCVVPPASTQAIEYELVYALLGPFCVLCSSAWSPFAPPADDDERPTLRVRTGQQQQQQQPTNGLSSSTLCRLEQAFNSIALHPCFHRILLVHIVEYLVTYHPLVTHRRILTRNTASVLFSPHRTSNGQLPEISVHLRTVLQHQLQQVRSIRRQLGPASQGEVWPGAH